MKKTLLFGVAAALALVITSCQIPSDYDVTVNEGIPSIDPPGDVRAVVFEGGIQVSWDPSKDAKDYQIFRRTYRDTVKTDQNGETVVDQDGNPIESKDFEDKLLAEVTTQLSYDDLVSYENQLQDGWEYEYTIVARSGNSTNKGKAVGQNDLIWNATAKSNRVTAKIPARGTKLAKPANLKVDAYTGLQYNNSGSLLVSWEKQIGAYYELTYRYKGPDGESTLKYNSNDPLRTAGTAPSVGSTAVLAPLGYWNLPDLTFDADHQFDIVEARAVFKTDYYLPSDIETASPASTPVRPAFNGNPQFAAAAKTNEYESIAGYPTQVYVDLTWDVLPGVDATTPYTLWKAESNSSGNLVTDWASIPATNYTPFNDQDSPFNKKLRYKDTAVEVGKYYQYILVVLGNNGGKLASKPVTVPVGIGEHPTMGDAEKFRQASSTSNITFVPLSNGSGVEIQWPAYENLPAATYTLYKSVVTVHDENTVKTIGGNTEANIATISGWTQVGTTDVNPKTPGQSTASGLTLVVYTVDSINTGSYYAYKVVANKTIDGKSESAKPVIRIVNVSPFVPLVELGITTAVSNADKDHVHTINVAVTQGAEWLGDITGTESNHIQLWRRVVNGAPATAFTQIPGVRLSGTSLTYKDYGQDLPFVLTSATAGSPANPAVQYQYKAVLIRGGSTITASGVSNVSVPALSPDAILLSYQSIYINGISIGNNGGRSSGRNGSTAGTLDNTIRFVVTGGKPLVGVPLKVRFNHYDPAAVSATNPSGTVYTPALPSGGAAADQGWLDINAMTLVTSVNDQDFDSVICAIAAPNAPRGTTITIELGYPDPTPTNANNITSLSSMMTTTTFTTLP